MMQIPPGHKRINDLVQELSRSNEIKKVLDIGCGTGFFVTYLREHDYDAIGIDEDEEMLYHEGLDNGYLFDLTAENSPKYLGENAFDLVITNGVMSAASAFAVLSHKKSIQTALENNDIYSKTNSEKILKTAHRLIKPGKFFAAAVDETLSFRPEQAEKLGYKVIKYKDRESILQKL